METRIAEAGRFFAGVMMLLALGVFSGCGSIYAACAESKYPATGQFVTLAGGVKIHYLREGKGSPVVFVHGATASAPVTKAMPMFADLTRDFEVIAPDRSGSGYSVREPYTTLTVVEHARILREFIAALKLPEKPILVGHSWGGAIVLAFATEYPGVCAGIVAVAPAAYPVKFKKSYFELTATPIAGDLFMETLLPVIGPMVAPKLEAMAFYPQKPDEAICEVSRAMALRPNQMRAESRDNLVFNGTMEGVAKKYPGIGVPVIILAGVSDKLIPVEKCRQLQGEIPGSEIRVLKDGSHMIPVQYPEEITKAVRDVVRAASAKR